MKKQYFFYIAIALIALVCRIISFKYNIYPHGDIFQEVLAARSLPLTKMLTLPYWASTAYQQTVGVSELVQITDKPPLWILLITAMSVFTKLDTYVSARLLSLLIGLLVVYQFYKLVAKCSHRVWAILSVMTLAISYLMIDYSGNGSRYMLQTWLLLLLIDSVLFNPLPKNNVRNTILLALLFLNNFQMGALLPLYLLNLILIKGRIWQNITKTIILFGLIISPWLWYNQTHYHTWFYSSNYHYILGKTNYPMETYDQNGLWVIKEPPKIDIVKQFINNLPDFIYHNLIFFTKKIGILLPIIYIIYLFIIFKSKQVIKDRKLMLLLIISVICLFIVSAWPVLKIRYLVTIYPLLLLTSVLVLRYFKKYASLILATNLLLTGYISISIYYKNPYHTYYYDGVFTEDQFKQKGEQNYMDKINANAGFAKQIPGDGTVAADLDKAYFVNNKIYMGDPFSSIHAGSIIDKYQIKYVWTAYPVSSSILGKYQNIRLIKQEKDQFLYQINTI